MFFQREKTSQAFRDALNHKSRSDSIHQLRKDSLLSLSKDGNNNIKLICPKRNIELKMNNINHQSFVASSSAPAHNIKDYHLKNSLEERSKVSHHHTMILPERNRIINSIISNTSALDVTKIESCASYSSLPTTDGDITSSQSKTTMIGLDCKGKQFIKSDFGGNFSAERNNTFYNLRDTNKISNNEMVISRTQELTHVASMLQPSSMYGTRIVDNNSALINMNKTSNFAERDASSSIYKSPNNTSSNVYETKVNGNSKTKQLDHINALLLQQIIQGGPNNNNLIHHNQNNVQRHHDQVPPSYYNSIRDQEYATNENTTTPYNSVPDNIFSLIQNNNIASSSAALIPVLDNITQEATTTNPATIEQMKIFLLKQIIRDSKQLNNQDNLLQPQHQPRIDNSSSMEENASTANNSFFGTEPNDISTDTTTRRNNQRHQNDYNNFFDGWRRSDDKSI